MGNAKLVPLKPITVSRLELTAALLFVKASPTLLQELEYENFTEFFLDRQPGSPRIYLE